MSNPFPFGDFFPMSCWSRPKIPNVKKDEPTKGTLFCGIVGLAKESAHIWHLLSTTNSSIQLDVRK